MKKSLSALAIGLVLLSLAACDDFTQMKAEPHIQKSTEFAEKHLKDARGQNETQVLNDPLKVSQKVWAGATAVRMRRGQPLPKTLEGDKGITLITTTPMSLGAIGAQISASSGIPVRLANDALGTTTAPGLQPLSTAAASGPSELNSPMTIAYEGPLSALLDQVGSHFNLSWRYDGSAISLFRYETRTFVMESMPGTQTLTDGLQSSQAQASGGGGAGGLGGASQNQQDVKQDSELKASLAFWDDLRTTIDSILGGEGRFITAPSSGTITVTTTPDRMRVISNFIENENARLARQVAINVEVYTVSVENADDYGLRLNSAFPGLDITNTGVTSPVSNTAVGTLAFLITDDNFTANGLISALSTLGKTAIVTRMPVTTLNNRPASRKITVDKAYLASISTSSVSGAGTATALTPGNISTGITLQLLPRLLTDGRIMLQYSLKISELLALTSFSATGTDNTSAAGDRIQLPEVSNKIFLQQAMLKNGSTLVLAGFDQDDQRGESRGIGSAGNWLFGGGFTNSKDRQYLVIAITPRELTTGISTQLQD